MAEFLREADFEGANGEPPSLCVAVSAATASMSAVVSATVASARSPTAVLLLHEPRRVLTPLAARYLYGRALLICGGWSESARELRAVLEQSRALAPLLAFVRVSEAALLRQLALAMLCDGQAHALLDLLHIYGMRSSAELAGSRLISPISADLADLVADALLCEFEPAQALSALETALETALVTTGFDTSHAPAVANASAAAHAPSALPPNASAATDSASRRTELRRRNNRACLLTCMDRFGEAEEELLQCVRLAPTELAPNFNLALLRWQVGEKDAAPSVHASAHLGALSSLPTGRREGCGGGRLASLPAAAARGAAELLRGACDALAADRDAAATRLAGERARRSSFRCHAGPSHAPPLGCFPQPQGHGAALGPRQGWALAVSGAIDRARMIGVRPCGRFR